MLKIKEAKLHTELFLAGKNLKTSLTAGKHHSHDLELDYDKSEGVLWVHCEHLGKKQSAIIPITNVVSMVPGEVIAHVEHVPVPVITKKFDAQVSSPQSHVFAGPGGGKTGKDK